MQANNNNSNSVPTLLHIAISKFLPNQLQQVKDILENQYDYDMCFITMDLEQHDATLEGMHEFNMFYDGWFGCPHRIEAFTIRPELYYNYNS